MKILNTEIDYNLTKVSNLKKVQNAFEEIAKKEKEIKNNANMDQLTKIEKLCNLYVGFFENVFGQETTVKIFGEEIDDFTKVFEALANVVDALNEQTNKFNGSITKYINRLK